MQGRQDTGISSFTWQVYTLWPLPTCNVMGTVTATEWPDCMVQMERRPASYGKVVASKMHKGQYFKTTQLLKIRLKS